MAKQINEFANKKEYLQYARNYIRKVAKSKLRINYEGIYNLNTWLPCIKEQEDFYIAIKMIYESETAEDLTNKLRHYFYEVKTNVN